MDFKKIFEPYVVLARTVISKASARPPVIGIDIGTSAVKAAAITSTATGLELSAWAVEPIDGDVKSALAKLLARLKLSSYTPVTSVSGKGTLIRYIDMPRMPLEDLRKSFVYELDKYFPFDPQSIYTDCFILDHNPKEKKMPVLVAAVKKDIIDERLKLFKDVGVDLGHITIHSIATANAFERLGPALTDSVQAKAILDIGGSVSTLLIIKDYSPRFTRDIFIGSQEMTRQIANLLGVDHIRADQLKFNPGERSGEVTEACASVLNHLVSEVRLSLDYFMTEKNIQIDEFFLMGGGALLNGIEGLFEKSLGMPVKAWDPLTRLRAGQEAARLPASSPQLGVAVGLGLANV